MSVGHTFPALLEEGHATAATSRRLRSDEHSRIPVTIDACDALRAITGMPGCAPGDVVADPSDPARVEAFAPGRTVALAVLPGGAEVPWTGAHRGTGGRSHDGRGAGPLPHFIPEALGPGVPLPRRLVAYVTVDTSVVGIAGRPFTVDPVYVAAVAGLGGGAVLAMTLLSLPAPTGLLRPDGLRAE